VHEFQTYIGVAETSYSKLLSRGRKYAFGLILAHQNTSQITKEILDNILGNVTSMICFSVAYSDAMRLGQQFIIKTGREMKPLSQEYLVDQKVGESIGKIGQTVFALHTPLAPQQPNRKRAEYIIRRSAQNYGLHSSSQNIRVERIQRSEPKLSTEKGGDDTPDIAPDEVF
jgi:hypothetical protein